MSEEDKQPVQQPVEEKPVENPVEEKKDAKGQAVYHVYCDHCGWTGYYHDYLFRCPKCGCPGKRQ